MAGKGKSSEITKVLEDNAGIIYKLSFMYANSKEEAEDLQQEIRYQVVKSYGQFKGDSKVSTWIYKVALFTGLTHVRTGHKAGKLVYEIPEIVESSGEQDRWTEVLEEIKKLPPVDRSLIFLYLENKSYAEMAEIMGMTETNIGARLSRAKQKLKQTLG